MSILLYQISPTEDTWAHLSDLGTDIHALIGDEVWPYPVQGGVRATYVQKCRDTVTGFWTSWETNYVDTAGAEYPGTGFDPGTYRVSSIFYDREVP